MMVKRFFTLLLAVLLIDVGFCFSYGSDYDRDYYNYRDYYENKSRNTSQKIDARRIEAWTAISLFPAAIAEAFIGQHTSETTKNSIKACTNFARLANGVMATYNHDGRARPYNIFRTVVYGYSFFSALYNLAKPKKEKPQDQISSDKKEPNQSKTWGADVKSNVQNAAKKVLSRNDGLKRLGRTSLGILEAWLACVLFVDPQKTIYESKSFYSFNLGNRYQSFKRTIGYQPFISSTLLAVTSFRTALTEDDTKKINIWSGLGGLATIETCVEAIKYSNDCRKISADLKQEAQVWYDACEQEDRELAERRREREAEAARQRQAEAGRRAREAEEARRRAEVDRRARETESRQQPWERAQGAQGLEGCNCSICLDSLTGDLQQETRLRCRHAFHVDCINGWINTGHYTCPNCRQEM